MNMERFQAALNYIGDDLIAEAADCKPKASIRAKPGSVIGYFAGTAAVVLAGVIGLKLWTDIKFSSVDLKNPSVPDDNISAIVSEMNPANSGGSSPGIRFSPVYGKGDPTLDEWLNFDNVIWDSSDIVNEAKQRLNNEGLKSDGEFSGEVKSGSVKMSAVLYNLITMELNRSSIFAVRVRFDSCIDEEEMDAWRYKGMTIREIKNKMSLAAADPGNHGVEELFELLDDAEYDYYLVQMQRFYENTFKPRDLEIYPIGKGSTIKGYNWFYCFMSAEMAAALTCKPDEAFFLDVADKSSAVSETN